VPHSTPSANPGGLEMPAWALANRSEPAVPRVVARSLARNREPLMRLLVVADDAQTRRTLGPSLSEHGHEVSVTTSEAGVREALQQNPSQLVMIFWLRTSRVNAVRLCESIRELEQGEDPVILICTDRGGQDDILQTIRAGADDCLA